MSAETKVKLLRFRRKRRVRSKLKAFNRSGRKRIYFHITNKNLYAQVIDDSTGQTLATVTTVSKNSDKNMANKQQAEALAERLAAKMQEKGLTSEKFVFDRGGKRYHGRVKVFADKLREKGIAI
ncbi:MAG: 50S ribosomal protein L18 [Candidatus Hydrogenedentota bacterium]|nr:MAG: 50S ribosomal protein L18 [Candidatus Hydrogenedentota bacterium]